MKIFRRSFRILLLMLGAGSFSASFSQSNTKPNIVIIIADDMGWNNIGFHNPEMKTPNIDGLAKKGVELTRFYTAAYCTPTRMGLLTGKYPERYGVRELGYTPQAIGGIPSEEVTLPELLQKAGYTNRGAFGKWHLGHSDVKYHPIKQGFTRFYGHYNGALDYFTHIRDGELDWHNDFAPSFDKGYSTDLIGREAVNFINKSAKAGRSLLMWRLMPHIRQCRQKKRTCRNMDIRDLRMQEEAVRFPLKLFMAE